MYVPVLESTGWCNSAASWAACPAGVVQSQQDRVNDPVSDREKAREMAEGRLGLAGIRLEPPGPHAAARISAIRLLRHFLAAAFRPPSRFALSYLASARRVPLPAVRFLSSSAVLAAVRGAAVRAGAGGRRRCGAGRFSCSRRVNGHG